MLPGLRSRWMIPWECKHSIARAMSRANPTAKRMSKRPGRKLTRYLRNVPPSKSSVTITMIGSLQAPMNYTHKKKTNQNVCSVVSNSNQTHLARKMLNLDQILVLNFRQHRDLSCKSAISFGDLFRRFSLFNNLYSNCFVFIPKTRKPKFKNQFKKNKLQWKEGNNINWSQKLDNELTFLHRFWHEILHQSWDQQRDVEDQRPI